MKKLIIITAAALLLGCLPTTQTYTPPAETWLVITVNYSNVDLISLNGSYALYDAYGNLWGSAPSPYAYGMKTAIKFSGSTSGQLRFWIGYNQFKTSQVISVTKGQTSYFTIDGNTSVISL
jgi:hypothetical protein